MCFINITVGLCVNTNQRLYLLITLYYESPDKRLYFVQAYLQRNVDTWLAKLYEYEGRQPEIRIRLVIAGVRST